MTTRHNNVPMSTSRRIQTTSCTTVLASTDLRKLEQLLEIGQQRLVHHHARIVTHHEIVVRIDDVHALARVAWELPDEAGGVGRNGLEADEASVLAFEI